MPVADIGQTGPEPLLEHLSGRLARQDPAQRRAENRQGRGKGWPDSFEECAALFHIAGDVVEVETGEDAAPSVAVEDYEIELMKLDFEELAGRKGDQREFADRRAVLFLGRPKYGEVHQIDGRIGLQNVAPGALAGMRLARDKQRLQPVAHAVHQNGGPIVDRRELVGTGVYLDLDQTDTATIEGDLDLLFCAERCAELFLDHAVLAYRNGAEKSGLRTRAAILDREGNRDRLADNGEGRHFADHESAVAFRFPPCPQQMKGGIHAQGAKFLRDIVNLAVADGKNSGNPLSRKAA